MRIDIISVVPELVESPLGHSIMKRAQDKGLITVELHNLRDFSTNKYRQIDDYPFGGGAGMVMMVEPIIKCIDSLKAEREYEEIIYMSPDGELFEQRIANELAFKGGNLIILCGHYKGVDERIREHYITREISIGDYVLSGGELGAAVVTDAIARLIPGVLGDETSALTDSFQDGLVAPPVYTRPADYKGWEVPKVLLSGDHKKIEAWRFEESVKRTRERRPALLKDADSKK
ncbi:tRNA (guanosine(37)-N1)-methyltransferase TrmD [Persicobacter psychrovividus]|uniref:tRNA (guanine-N(1)-)-methyltransferase n=1 Tax=Persicobacter psychrovividus TaxID=387638 RepID=A0ABN6LB50_9BACT|nr:tRNA (guanine-N(1)-)-methyltransferase [Persicobacter psychrovividus]